jgi:Crp-like helix-turn-helix domain/Cytochrome c
MFVTTLGMVRAQGEPAQKPPARQANTASGKETFVKYCASCHGEDGKGNGPAAIALKPPPSDLTTLSKRHEGKYGQPQRVSTAATITLSTILAIEKPEMIRLLYGEQALPDRFIKHVLSKNIRIEEDLVDQLLNSAEKRLARTLLSLARYGNQAKPERMVPGISQEMLAEMIGTTRSRVSFFMNKFRKLGFIECGGTPPWLQINESFFGAV